MLLFGDASPSNLIYKSTDDEKASDELLAIIDWQTAHYGTCSNDLALMCSLLADSTETEALICEFYEV